MASGKKVAVMSKGLEDLLEIGFTEKTALGL
jgi:hypothetical protein